MTNGIFFKSGREDTIKAIYKEFGTHGFDKYIDFKNHFLNVTSEPFTGMFYDSNSEENYFAIIAPKMTKINVQLEY